MISDKCPFLLSGFQILCLLRFFLIAIQESDHSLCLYPPDSVHIYDTSVTFVCQRVSVECHLIDLRSQVFGDGIHLLRQFRIIQHLTASVDQPCCLNIVTIGMQIQNGIVMLIKEHFLSVQLGIIDLFSEQIHDPKQASTHLFVAGYPVQLRICFKYM